MSTTVPEDHQGHDVVEVVVRTPAGASQPFTFDRHELAANAVATSIDYFVKKHEIEPGDYALELVREGHGTPIPDTARLSDYDIRDKDQLHLIAERPQVDG